MVDSCERQDRGTLPRAAWIVCGMVFLIPITIWGLGQLQLSKDVDWIDRDAAAAQGHRWFGQHFPGDEPLLFSWEESSLDDNRIPAFLDTVRGHSDAQGHRKGGFPEVARIRTPHELIDRVARSSGSSRAETIDRMRGVLVGSGPLRIRLTDAARPHQEDVIKALQREVRAYLTFPVEVLTDTSVDVVPTESAASSSADTEPQSESATETAASPTATDSAGADAATAEEFVLTPDDWRISAPHDFAVRWQGIRPNCPELQQFERILQRLTIPGEAEPAVAASFFVPGSPIGLAIELTEAGLAERTATIEKLRAAAVAAGIPAATIHVGGRAAVGSALDQAVLRAVWNPAVPWHSPQRSLLGLCALAGALLAFAMLRNFRLTLLVLGVSYFTTLIGLALVPILGNTSAWQAIAGSDGRLNIVLVLMPALLLVTTLSGGIHFANYWQHAAARDLGTATSEALRAACRPCLWSGITTALGLLALVVSSLKPVREFGVYSALGVFVALGMILLGLPALLRLLPARGPSPEDDLDAAGWRALGRFVVRARWGILALVLTGTGVALAGLQQFRTETRVIRYFGETTAVVHDYQWLEQNLSGVVPVEVVVRFDKEAQDELQFLQRAEKIRQIQSSLRQLPDISGTLSLADFLPVVPDPGDNASLPKKRAYYLKSRGAQERIERESEARRLRVRAETASPLNAAEDELWRITAHVAAISDVDYDTLTRRINEQCQEVLRAVSGKGGDNYRLADVDVQYHPGASHLVTGAVPLYLANHNALLRSLGQSFLLALATIGVVLMVQFRSLAAGLIALLPNVVPIGAVFGLIAWMGVRVDLGTVITASIAFGIAVDGTVHLVTRFRHGLELGLDRHDATVAALGHCAPALWQTSLIIVVGLLMLVPCDLVLISRFGWVMASLIVATLLSDTLLTPALLAGPLGWVLERALPCRDEPRRTKHSSAPPSVRFEDARPPRPHLTQPARVTRSEELR